MELTTKKFGFQKTPDRPKPTEDMSMKIEEKKSYYFCNVLVKTQINFQKLKMSFQHDMFPFHRVTMDKSSPPEKEVGNFLLT